MSKKRRLEEADEPATKKPKLSRQWTHTQPDGSRSAYGRLRRIDSIDEDVYEAAQVRKGKARRRARKKKKKPAKAPKPAPSPPTTPAAEFRLQYAEDQTLVLSSCTKRFNGFVAIVTGGGRGAGAAIARRLASEGAIVHIFDKTRFRDTVAAIQEEHKEAQAFGHRVDITNPNAIEEKVDHIIETAGQIDCVVQCVNFEGTVRGKQTHEVERDEFQGVLDVNLFGVFNVAKAVLPHMIERDYGRIVNIVSSAGKEGDAFDIAYATSKAAVICATKCMGKEYAEKGITVNAICAGRTSEVLEEDRNVPMLRTGEFEELAGMVAFVASEENSYTTGFCFDFTGGSYV